MTSPPPSSPRPRLGDELIVDVERLTYGGEGIGHAQGLAVFVPRAAPGDLVRARVRKVHRRHVEADLAGLEKPGPQRIAPRCPHFEEGCGGCTWQHVAYPAQLEAKAASVRDSLERLGGFRDLPILPILAAPDTFYYRNKMEFAFHPQGGLGLHPRGAWYDILALEECFLESPLALTILKAARKFVLDRGISLYHPRSQEGLLRELSIRQSRGTGQTLIGIVTSPGPFAEAAEMAAHLATIDKGITSVVRTIRASSCTSSPLGETSVLFGTDHITEITAGLRFRIHVETFYQTNSAQAEHLVSLVKSFAGDVSGASVVDVYCGVGVFTLALAAAGAQVTGVEIVETAVQAARRNAADNGIENVVFHAGDARTVLAEVLPAELRPKVLVLDPPRAGAGGKVMRRIARACPEKIIYVSCNPTTLARDLMELRPFGYHLTAVQPIDLFPQTYHVETVATLERA